jgi:signal transduction histidine kinase
VNARDPQAERAFALHESTLPPGSTPQAMPIRSDWSLLVRLAWIAMTAVLVSLVFGGFAMFWAASIQNEQMLDARLEQFGATLQALVDESLTQHGSDPAVAPAGLKTRPAAALLYRYQVWSRDGAHQLIRSHEAPATLPLADIAQLGYSTRRIEGEDYRVFSLPTHDGTHVVQVAENINEAWTQVGLTTVYYAAFLLVPFALLFGATWWLLRRALHSIRTLANSLADRNPLDLSPLPVVAPPREIVPILRAIDMLFGRMQRALSIERSFTSMAAHEMRTPLAGVRAQAQLLTQEDLADEPMQTVRGLIQGVDRASHLLDQLLDLARVESLVMAGEPQFEPVKVADIYQEVARDLLPRVRRHDVTVAARLAEHALECHAFALSVLMRNLLANAILYTPAGGRVEIATVRLPDHLLLSVDDSGRGIPQAQRERAFERFNRLGRAQADGVGLGLSIVLLVVEMHSAKIQLADSPLGGLRVQVAFPRMAATFVP